ncbi:MAG: hypothetical protein AAGI38_10530, partial [Bacteroidota bacterium]
LFKLTARINHLKKAEELLEKVRLTPMPDHAPVLRQLARVYISQHRFCEALDVAMQALETGSGMRETQLLLCDIYAELGFAAEENYLLHQLAREQEDAHLKIRLAKWADGIGRLDQTIELMEEVKQKAISTRQESLLNWSYTNLGDFYGHAGEIDKAAAHYLKALEINPADWYAVKGLAWILYSHEEKPTEALSLLEAASQWSDDPGIELLQAEIWMFMGATELALKKHAEIAMRVQSPEYGRMYSEFLCDFFLDNDQPEKALELASEEIRQRAVPSSFAMLIDVYLSQGDTLQARRMSQDHIWHQTFEPKLLLKQVSFFSVTDLSYIQDIKAELSEARFELGPVRYAAMLGKY